MMAKRLIWIDTDTASDDAVALVMALRSADVEVVGISVVAGNVELDQAVSNALYTVELCGCEVPVFAGADKPLQRPLEKADWFHGRDGLGDCGFVPRRRTRERLGAVEAMGQLLTEPMELVTLGPLTNVALLLEAKPQVARSITRCVVMGGNPCCEGNVTPAAEFNIWADPEAAAAVFRSELPLELVGWQLSRGAAVVNEEEMQRLKEMNTPFAKFALESNQVAVEAYRVQTGEHGISLPDPVAMAILLEPRLVLESSKHWVAIETASELTRGMTVIDRLGVTGDVRNRATWANWVAGELQTKIAWKLDVPGFKRMLFDAHR